MGVKIRDLIKPREINFKELNGKTIAIDTMNVLYQFLSIIIRTDTAQPLTDRSGRVTSHISGLFYRSINLIENGIRPIYVFDGKPSELKNRTIRARKTIREEAKEEHEKAIEEGDILKALKYAKTSYRVSKEMVKESKELLKNMGISYVQAESEGESQAAYMVMKGDAWAVGSQDYDSLLFGAPILVRNLTISGKRRGKGGKIITVVPEIICLEDVLKSNNLTREQLIDIGIMIGTDFNDGVKGVGIKTALKLIRKYGNFGKAYKSEKFNFEGDYETIKNIFLKPKVNSQYIIKKYKPNFEKLKELLVNEYNFNETRVEKGISRLKKARSISGQKKIDSFFT
ncbi:MAG: flap endonuclease-1 [Candidatus Helarchaeota archaeon]